MTALSLTRGNPLGAALGWFSVGLGLLQLTAPRTVARWTGRKHTNPMLIRALGLRELTTGLGILSSKRPARWLWARVAGDALDLALLGASFGSRGVLRGKAAAATTVVAAVSALDVLAGRKMASASNGHTTVPATASIIVNRPINECFEFWCDAKNLSQFLHNPDKQPATVEVVESTANLSLAWRQLDGASGRANAARFEPAPVAGATRITVELGGEVTREQLRRFKQYMETGEISTTRGQPAGHRSLAGKTFRRLEP